VHLLFALILVGSVLTKTGTTDAVIKDRNLASAVMYAAQSHGWIFRDHTTINGTDISALAFAAPGCGQPVLVALLLAAFDQSPMVRSALETGYALRYFYIDRAWEAPDRLAVFLERARHLALAVFALTPYVPSRDVLLVEAPLDCQSAGDVDWRVVWERDYPPAGDTGATATR
jgi:hypothetical protein